MLIAPGAKGKKSESLQKVFSFSAVESYGMWGQGRHRRQAKQPRPWNQELGGARLGKLEVPGQPSARNTTNQPSSCSQFQKSPVGAGLRRVRLRSVRLFFLRRSTDRKHIRDDIFCIPYTLSIGPWYDVESSGLDKACTFGTCVMCGLYTASKSTSAGATRICYARKST